MASTNKKLTESDIEALKIYHDVVLELVSEEFNDTVVGSSYKLNWNNSSGVSESRAGPSLTQMKAFACTLRQFFLEKEITCLKTKIHSIYTKRCHLELLREKFEEQLSYLDSHLDQNSTFKVNGKHYSNRELLHIYWFGIVSHTQDRKEIMKLLKSPMFGKLVENELVYILHTVASVVANVNGINNDLLKKQA